MELNESNLVKCKLDPALMKLFNTTFMIYQAYKYTRSALLNKIITGSDQIEVNGNIYYWLRSPMTYHFGTLQWLIHNKEPENLFKEPKFRMKRHEIIGFHLISKKVLEYFESKSDLEAASILSYRLNSEICKLTKPYEYMKLDQTIIGGVTLQSHLEYVVNAIENQNEDYKLILNILNK